MTNFFHDTNFSQLFVTKNTTTKKLSNWHSQYIENLQSSPSKKSKKWPIISESHQCGGGGCQKHQINLAFGNPQIIIRYGRRKLFVLEREILFPDPVSFSFDDHLFGIDKIERTKTTLFC